MNAGRWIDEAALAAPVTGVGLVPGTLGDQLEVSGDRVSLLVFLRHFGCIFCRETIADLRAASEANPDYPDVLFFFQGSATEGRAFLRRYWPEARAVADPELAFYERFGIRRATFLEALGPSVVIGARRRAQAKGHESGPREGDIWRMPGIFAVADKKIVWAHHPKHAADHPDFPGIPAIVAAATTS
ncbi:MAG: SelL-related redox protein [Myxococcota bacterium]